MSSFYSGGGRIAQATVRVTPDLTGFQAQLQASVNKAFAGVQVPPIGGAGAARGASGLRNATVEANALRGALIGLSRVTPVTVFGLGAWGTAGIAAGIAISSTVKSVAEFEKQLNTLQAITRISDEELQNIRESAIALGGDTTLAAISASDAAVAMTELSKAGLTVRDTMDAARGVLELAGAAEISAGDAARFVATELNAFKLAGSEAGRVVDLLASASIAAQGEIGDFGNAFQQVSAVAAQAGLTVEQTTGALTLLAKAGITSSDAGTSLRTFLLRLIPTTKQAGAFVKALGVELDQSKTEGEQLTSIIEQYRNALIQLNPIQRTNVLNQIFGQDAVRAASVLLTQNTGELDKQIEALGRQGVAAELNKAKSEGLSGAFAGLQSNLETLSVQIGGFVDGPIEKLVRGISDAITTVEKVAGELEDLATFLANWKPVELGVNVVVDVTSTGWSKIPGPVQFLLKERLKGSIPIIGPGLVALDVADALIGGDGDQVGPSPPLVGKAATKLEASFGSGLFLKGIQDKFKIGGPEWDKTFGKAARANKEARAKLRKAVQAEIDKQSGATAADKGIDLDITAPQKFLVAQLKAQLSHSLQAELAADEAIRGYFQARLSQTKEGSKRYAKVLGALQQADAAVQAVQAQIDQQADAAQRERDRRTKERLKRLKEEKEKAAQLAKSQIELQNEILVTRLGRAQLTESKRDDIRIYRLQIDAAREDIKRQRKIAAENGKASQARIDALIQIQKDLQKINSIKDAIKSLKNKDKKDQGFTIAELFKEAQDTFNTFAGNIAPRGGVFGGAGAQAAFSAQLLGGRTGDAVRDAITRQGDKQLRATEETNSILRRMGGSATGIGTGTPHLPGSGSTGGSGGWGGAGEGPGGTKMISKARWRAFVKRSGA